MKNSILIIAALLIGFYADGNAIKKSGPQLVSNEHGIFFISGSKTPFTGKYASYFANGVKSEESTYENGILRKVFNWDKDGKKRMVKLFETDGSLKNHIIWYANGHKAYEEYYENNMKNGVVASWNDRGGKVSESHYTNRQLNGLSTAWYDNGQKSHEGRWINGYLTGSMSKWKRGGGKTP